MNRKSVNRRIARFALGIILLGLLATAAMDAIGKTGKQEQYSALDLYTEVFSKVQELYVREVDPRELVYASINGMLQSLDSHSTFLEPDMMKEMRLQISGSYGGLGMRIGKAPNGYIRVEGVFDDTPSSRAGLKPKDLIIKIENKDTINMSVSEAAEMMRGKPHTKVTIHVIREGWKEPRKYALTREKIELKSLREAEVLDEKIGHIWLRSFQDSTSDELAQALNKMERDPGLRGLILDLRDNPGGPLKQAIEVADTFLEKGVIVSIKGRAGQMLEDKEYKATSANAHTSYPMVVLVNGGSASASEIVAGALQDHGRAVILGTKTFGKGSVQTILELKDGSGLKLTTALYYTPSGRSIQAKGIEPDIVVEEGRYVKTEGGDEHLREENLPQHFENPEKTKDGAPKTVPSATEEERKEESRKVDAQLERALEILKSWVIFQGAQKKAAGR